MRISSSLLILYWFVGSLTASSFAGQRQPAISSRILSAKSVYFDNQTGNDAVGRGALGQLKKWGKFKIIPDRIHADLIIALSNEPKGGSILLSGGQTGTIDSRGHIEEDRVPVYNEQSQTRFASLAVIDAITGENLWSGQRIWGGLLTGFNSVGKRLISDLEKETRK